MLARKPAKCDLYRPSMKGGKGCSVEIQISSSSRSPSARMKHQLILLEFAANAILFVEVVPAVLSLGARVRSNSGARLGAQAGNGMQTGTNKPPPLRIASPKSCSVHCGNGRKDNRSTPN